MTQATQLIANYGAQAGWSLAPHALCSGRVIHVRSNTPDLTFPRQAVAVVQNLQMST